MNFARHALAAAALALAACGSATTLQQTVDAGHPGSGTGSTGVIGSGSVSGSTGNTGSTASSSSSSSSSAGSTASSGTTASETIGSTASSSSSSSSSSSGSTGTSSASSSSGSASSSSTGSTGLADAGCLATSPDNFARKVVISHPFSASGDEADVYEILGLSVGGELTSTGVTFEMGSSFDARIAFTPDGRFGFAPQDDGSIGFFELLADGGVNVRRAHFGVDDGGNGSRVFYATAAEVSADGTTLFVLDEDTLNNGGGVYTATIACDGTISQPAKQGTFDRADAIGFLHASPWRAIEAGGAALGSSSTQDTHLVDFSSGATVVSNGQLWEDDGGAIPSAVALTQDDGYALVADNGLFRGNRVGVVRVGTNAISKVGIISTVAPYDVVTSPYDNAALVLNSPGSSSDGYTLLSYDPNNSTTPFASLGQVAYVGDHPMLPAKAVVIRRGALNGRVLAAENSGVRQLQFEADGGVKDLSIDNGDGSDLAAIVGSIGAQP